MKNKTIKIIAVIVMIIAVIIMVRTFVSAAVFSFGDDIRQGMAIAAESVTATENTTPTDYQMPVQIASSSALADPYFRLYIPALDIDAPIQKVGINAKGNMASPSNFSDVAWYSKGTIPGRIGSAVIAGHLDNGLGLAGVFKRLTDVNMGDDVYVENTKGTSSASDTPLQFVVTDITYYDYDDPALAMIFDTDTDRALIRLVTCDGKWVPGDKTYDKRIIVTAELVK